MRVRRWILALVALGLVPVLVFTSPGIAEAASTTAYGTAVAWSADNGGDNVPDGNKVSCNFQSYWVTTPSFFEGLPDVSFVRTGYACSKSWYVRADTVSWHFEGTSCTTQQSPSEDGDASAKGIDTDLATGTAAGCSITQACYEIDADTPLSSDTNQGGCVPIALGVPPVVGHSSTCTIATVTKPIQTLNGVTTDANSKWMPVDEFQIGWHHISDTSGGDFAPYFVYSHTDGDNSYTPEGITTSRPVEPNGMRIAVNSHTGSMNINPYSPNPGSSHNSHQNGWATWQVPLGQDAPTEYALGGVGKPVLDNLGQTPNPGAMARGWTLVGYGYIYVHNSAQETDPLNTGASLFGRTTAASNSCSWYWGDPIATNGTSAENTPLGPVGGGDGPPPDPGTVPSGTPQPSDTCNFSLTDPSSWVGGALCHVVGLLQGIWHGIESLVQAVSNLAANIAGAILDGLSGALQALFVPPSGFWGAQVTSVRHSWDQTPPVQIVGGLSTVAGSLDVSSPGSACQGPPLTVTNPMTHGSQTVYLMSSCAGGVATLATITRAGLSVAVYVAAFLIAVRILAASIGLSVSFGSGADES